MLFRSLLTVLGFKVHNKSAKRILGILMGDLECDHLDIFKMVMPCLPIVEEPHLEEWSMDQRLATLKDMIWKVTGSRVMICTQHFLFVQRTLLCGDYGQTKRLYIACCHQCYFLFRFDFLNTVSKTRIQESGYSRL